MIRKIDDFDSTSYHGQCAVTNLPKTKGEAFVVRLARLDRGGYFDIRHNAALEIAEAVGCKAPKWLKWNRDEQQKKEGELRAFICDLVMDIEILQEEERTILGLANELALVSALKDDAIEQFQELEAKNKAKSSK